MKDVTGNFVFSYSVYKGLVSPQSSVQIPNVKAPWKTFFHLASTFDLTMT